MPPEPQQSSREDQAVAEIGITAISRRAAWVLTSIFLLTIASVPILDQFTGGYHAWAALLSPGQTSRARSFESSLEDSSTVAKFVRPITQRLLTQYLHTGSEKVDVGRDTWLFYDPDVMHVAGRGFLDFQLDPDLAQSYRKRQLQSHRSTNPIPAILDFARQLKSHGIQLILIPTPVKPMIHPEKLWPDVQSPIENHSLEQFKDQLNSNGILVFDPTADLIAAAQSGNDQYLARDTHWRPEAMDLAATALTKFVTDHGNLPQSLGMDYQRTETQITARGDLDAILDAGQHLQTVTISPISFAGQPWAPDDSSTILWLGDSFSNIYSAEPMGWGASAGFAEQFSYHISRPLDALRRNDNGAYATRQMLADELSRGNDRLAHKKLLIWQFADRELSFGDWKLINLTLTKKPPVHVIVPPIGQKWTITGTVAEMGAAPRPGSVAYRDHIISIHLTNITIPEKAITGAEAVVYLRSMIDNKLTPAATLHIGQRIDVIVRDWSEVSRQFELINRSDLPDPALRAQPACWGELQPAR